MADKATLEALLERVEKAEGADRTLSRDISRAFGLLGHPTASIDNALTLVERLLPGWRISMSGTTDLSLVLLMEPGYPFGSAKKADSGPLDRPMPCAILAALLRALIARADDIGSGVRNG